MTESRDRKALRQIAYHSGASVQARDIALAALAQPDPAEELAEALRVFTRAGKAGPFLIGSGWGEEVDAATAAIAKWEVA